MAFDYKKEYKEFYMPKNKPEIITVPSMNFIAVRGQGDPSLKKKGLYLSWQVRHILEKGKLYFLGVVRFIASV